MGLPLMFLMPSLNLPTPNLWKHEEAAHIPGWRGEARWRLLEAFGDADGLRSREWWCWHSSSPSLAQ